MNEKKNKRNGSMMLLELVNIFENIKLRITNNAKNEPHRETNN